MRKFTEQEVEFVNEAETAMLRMLSAWHDIISPLNKEQRLRIEAALLMKALILIARDGLAIDNVAGVAELLIELWKDDEDGLVA